MMSSNAQHVYHRHVPMNWCASEECDLPQHQDFDELDDSDVSELGLDAELLVMPFGLTNAPGTTSVLEGAPVIKENESSKTVSGNDSESKEEESSEEESSDDDGENSEFSTFRVNRFVRDIERSIDQDDSCHKDLNPDACICFTCPYHPNGARDLRHLVRRLDIAVNTKQAGKWHENSGNEVDQQ